MKKRNIQVPRQKKKDPALVRKKILDAACRIFSRHAYTAASIRMIAREGGVPHALIRYYYPTKADLFDAVAEQICSDLYISCEKATLDANRMEREKGFSHYVLQLIRFHQDRPWVFRLLLLNTAVETVQTVPGQTIIIDAVESIREMLIRSLNLKAPHEEICRFTDSFNALVFYYLGTPESAAWMLRLKPDSEAYYQWVHQTLTSIFLPSLDGLFNNQIST